MAITYNDLYLDLRQKLRLEQVEAYTLAAREIVCYAAGKTRQELQRDGRLYVPQDVEKRVQELTARHLAGEPVAFSASTSVSIRGMRTDSLMSKSRP